MLFKLDAPANCHVVSHLRILPYSGQIICRRRENSNEDRKKKDRK
jgi:hypothetical protein